MNQPHPESSSSKTSLKKRLLIAIPAALLCIVLLVGVALVVPIFRVNNFAIEGVVNTQVEEVEQASGIAQGSNLLRIDVQGAAQRVAALPWVETATVSRDWPSTVAIEVKERDTVAFTRRGDGEHLVDANGVAFVIAPPPPGAVEITGTTEDDPALLAEAVEIYRSLAPHVAEMLASIDLPNQYNATLHFKDGRSAHWGSAERLQEKARVVEVVLTQPGEHWDVSDPYLVTKTSEN